MLLGVLLSEDRLEDIRRRRLADRHRLLDEGVFICRRLKFVPDRRHLPRDLRLAVIPNRLRPVDRQVLQERVTDCDAHVLAALVLVHVVKVQEILVQVLLHLIRPRLLQILPVELRELQVRALLGKCNVKEARHGVEIQELVVDDDLRVVRLLRDQTPHVRRDGIALRKLRD